MEFTEKQIDEAMNKAYKKGKYNAYFGNGFRMGVRFAAEAANGSAVELLWKVVQADGDCSGTLMNEINDYFKSRANV